MTEDYLNSYLENRAQQYGGSLEDLLSITPDCLDTAPEQVQFWKQRDISHWAPQAHFPAFSDNWALMFPEEPSTNRARGACIVNPLELANAWADNNKLAQAIDTDHSDSYDDYQQDTEN
jgi:hypothetical protein